MRKPTSQDPKSLPPEHVDFPRWRYSLPPDLEKEFIRQTEPSRDLQIRKWHGIGLGYSFFLMALDLWSMPEIWYLTVFLRFLVVAPLTLWGRSVLARTARQPIKSIASFAPFCAINLTGIVLFSLSGRFDFQRAVFVLVTGIIWVGAPVPLHFRDAVRFFVVSLVVGGAVCVAGLLTLTEPIVRPALVCASLALIGLSLFGRFVIERRLRVAFMQGLQLQRQVEELKQTAMSFEKAARTDELTGLNNRRCFDEALPLYWLKAKSSHRPLVAMMIDIDHFKRVNDTLGHLEGDHCIAAVAREIAEHVRRDHDFTARYGGEEFVVLMPQTTETEAQEVAERIRAEIFGKNFFGHGRVGVWVVTVSVGIAEANPANTTISPRDLIAAADAALYSAKRTGRNRVNLAGPGTQAPGRYH